MERSKVNIGGGHIQGPFPQQYNRYPVQTSLARKLKTQKDVTIATFKRTWNFYDNDREELLKF